MLNKLTCVLAAGLMLGLTACSGGASSSDEGKTVATIKAEVKDADTGMIESMIESYKSAIAGHEDELKTLQEKIAEMSGGMIDDLLGGKSDEVKADLTKLNAQVTDITSTLKALKDKLAVYVQEFASRTDG